MSKRRSKTVSAVGSHVREPQASAPPRLTDRSRLGRLFSEPRRCACGALGTTARPLAWVVTEVRVECDEEGLYRQVTRCDWKCCDCRQLQLRAL
jgi:hypothetical protein